jgi:hypothetical protein
MAKKQTRRSISVSRSTYERLKAFCETNNISMSQLVETRVNDFLGADQVAPAPAAIPSAPRPMAMPVNLAPRSFAPPSAPVSRPYERPAPAVHAPVAASTPVAASAPVAAAPAPIAPPVAPAASVAPAAAPTTAPAGPAASSTAAPMTSAAARFAVDPPPPIIKPRQDTAAPKPAEKRPEQIFTF